MREEDSKLLNYHIPLMVTEENYNRTKLEKEAREKYHNHKIMDFQGFYNHHYYYLGYVESAEPREKQIEIDAEQIRALQKQNGELTDNVKELEAQIEKMKCCGNCQKLRGRFDSKTNINILYCSDSDMKQIEVGFQMCCCKWEIKEK